MKLHFEPDLPHQRDAIRAVCDLFAGHRPEPNLFTVRQPVVGGTADMFQSTGGYGNALKLLPDELLENLQQVQMRSELRPSAELKKDDYSFTVEMETGTGKTYVYLRTILQLNKEYGFTKFVIVVPSVAIKEGVLSTLKSTREHFAAEFPGLLYDFFAYDSADIQLVRDFATKSTVQIMLTTVGAINKFGDEAAARAEEVDEGKRRAKSANVMYRVNERTGDDRPIDVIAGTRPIVIVDEPQSVYGGLDGKGGKALKKMAPLCTIRYSATHIDKENMIYRLDAIDAYQQELVKQIAVASPKLLDGQNQAYVRVISVSYAGKSRVPSARIEVDAARSASVVRTELHVSGGEDLEELTGRTLYQGYRIGEIIADKGNECIQLLSDGQERYLAEGEEIGGLGANQFERLMLRKTIEVHLKNELRLKSQGIKVLSLFFIENVSDYRKYLDDGTPVKGELAVLFEEEYSKVAKQPMYRTLFNDVDLVSTAAQVHDGYFSVDKRVHSPFDGDRELAKTASRELLDGTTFNLIMRDKERLLKFETPLKFIFSHSALKEGWDNPNVFQICNLRHMEGERQRRQTIGRGLRICVNQKGIRVRDTNVNTLTVIAREGYAEFAEKLQKELEDPKTGIGIKFGIVDTFQFSGIAVEDGAGNLKPLGDEQSKALFTDLQTKGYLDKSGKITSQLRRALRDDRVDIPDEFQAQRERIVKLLTKLAGKLDIKDSDNQIHLHPNRVILDGNDFQELWNRIKHQTVYRVKVDTDKFVAACLDQLSKLDNVPVARVIWEQVDLEMTLAGVSTANLSESSAPPLGNLGIELPDLLTDLEDATGLTRRTLLRIVIESGRLEQFRSNPRFFVDMFAKILNRQKKLALVEGIRYQRLGGEAYYAQELFDKGVFTGYLQELHNSRKAVFDQFNCDSDVERRFAEKLDGNDNVKVYAKLPSWFKIPTPLGPYNPDWAVLIDTAEGQRLYLVAETKGTNLLGELRATEEAKILCGKAHFEALRVAGDTSIRFQHGDTLDYVLGQL